MNAVRAWLGVPGLLVAVAAVGLAGSANALDETEANDTPATANALTTAGTALSAAFPPGGGGALFDGALAPDDVDHVAFDLQVGDLLTVEGSSDDDGSFGDPAIRLLDPQGTAVAEDDDAGGGFLPAIAYRVPVGGAGRYVLAITGFGDAEFDGAASGASHAETGDYRMVASVVTDPPGTTEPTAANDDAPNADPIPELGGPFASSAPGGVANVAGSLDPADVDYWAIPVDGPGRLTVSVYDADAGVFHDPALELRDGGGVLVTTDDDEGPGFGARAATAVPSAGTYTVAVSGFGDPEFDGGHDESFDYRLVVSYAADVVLCDANADGTIDAFDIDAILADLDLAVPAGDPRDGDGDGVLTVLDARVCTLSCDYTGCSPAPACGLLGLELLVLAPFWLRRRRNQG